MSRVVREYIAMFQATKFVIISHSNTSNVNHCLIYPTDYGVMWGFLHLHPRFQLSAVGLSQIKYTLRCRC